MGLLLTTFVGAQEKPPAVELAARNVLVAKDDAALKALAEKDQPDPWLVAHELCKQGHRKVALAFARAAPRPDTAQLPHFVEHWEKLAPDPELREKLRKALELLKTKQAAAAYELLADASAPPNTVAAVSLALRRAQASHFVGKPKAVTAQLVIAADAAREVGWLRAAADDYEAGSINAYHQADLALAAQLGTRRLEVAIKRERHRDQVDAQLSLADILVAAGKHERAERLRTDALSLARELGDERLIADALLAKGNGALARRQIDTGRPLIEEAIAIYRKVGDRSGMGACEMALGAAFLNAERYAEARAPFERALELYEAIGSRPNIAIALINLGAVDRRLGRHTEARSSWLKALKLLGDGNPVERARVHAELTDLAADMRDAKATETHGRQAFALYRQLGDRSGQARVCISWANLHMGRGAYEQCATMIDRATKLYESVGDRNGLAEALAARATLHRELGEYERALALTRKAAALRADSTTKFNRAASAGLIGAVLLSMNRTEEAIPRLREAAALWRELGDASSEAEVLHNLAIALRDVPDYAESTRLLRRTVEILRSLGDHDGIARTQGALAINLRHEGRIDEAVALLEASLANARKTGRAADELSLLTNLGLTLSTLGEVERARASYEEALVIARRLGHEPRETALLLNLGALSLRSGQLSAALRYSEAAVDRARRAGDRRREVAATTNAAMIYLRLGDTERSKRSLSRATEVAAAIGDRVGHARALSNLVILHLAAGEWKAATAAGEAALAKYREFGGSSGIAKTLSNVAIAYEQLDEFEKAVEATQEALRLKRKHASPGEVAISLANLASFQHAAGATAEAEASLKQARRLAAKDGSDWTTVRILDIAAKFALARGDTRAAMQAARDAVALMPSVAGRLADEYAAGIRQELSIVYARGAEAALSGGTPDDLFYFLEAGRAGALLESLGNRPALEAARLSPELRRREARTRAAVVGGRKQLQRAVAGGRRRDIAAARSELDEAEEALRATVLAIQSEAKASAHLLYPEPITIDEVRRHLEPGDAFVSYALFKQPAALVVTREDARVVKLGALDALIEACGDHSFHERDGKFEAPATRLRRLLVEPLALPTGTRRVYVSPHGETSFVPLALLLGDRDVVYVPSASTLAFLRSERHSRGRGVLGLGDPVYGKARSPLPGTRAEVKAVADVALLGADATETRLRREAAGRRWRALHFACHGLIEPERPSFSALALSADKNDDGLLTMLEVMRQPFHADLIVLSACETALGRTNLAEGIVGFPRAFLVSGADRVVVSLWKVDDESTRALMTKFYELWAKHPTATALRKAQEFVRGHEKWSHPHYWAAWQLWGLAD